MKKLFILSVLGISLFTGAAAACEGAVQSYYSSLNNTTFTLSVTVVPSAGGTCSITVTRNVSYAADLSSLVASLLVAMDNPTAYVASDVTGGLQLKRVP